MKLKGLHFADVAEIQEAITDELKKTQKEEFSTAFQKLYDRTKACMYANRAYFELKKKSMCLPHVSLIFKKISAKTFEPHCVYAGTWVWWYVCTCMFVLSNMRLYEKEISILTVFADPGIFIRIIRYYLCTINSIAGIAT